MLFQDIIIENPIWKKVIQIQNPYVYYKLNDYLLHENVPKIPIRTICIKIKFKIQMKSHILWSLFFTTSRLQMSSILLSYQVKAHINAIILANVICRCKNLHYLKCTYLCSNCNDCTVRSTFRWILFFRYQCNSNNGTFNLFWSFCHLW